MFCFIGRSFEKALGMLRAMGSQLTFKIGGKAFMLSQGGQHRNLAKFPDLAFGKLSKIKYPHVNHKKIATFNKLMS